MQLPDHLDPTGFDEDYRTQPALWRAAIEEVVARLGLPRGPIEAYPEGSNLVARVGPVAAPPEGGPADEAVVVKIFPPFHRDQWESERRALGHFAGRLSLPTPALHHAASRPDGWFEVVMGLCPGVPLSAHWAGLAEEQKIALMGTIGETMRQAHALPVGAIADLPPDWATFLPAQVAGCRARHERHRVPAWVCEAIDDFVPAALARLTWGPTVALTGEYTPFNLLIDEQARLSAMIDFGDGMVGPAAYDLLGPVAFLGGGERARLEAFYAGRGWPFPDQTQAEGLLALLLCHRYSYLRAQVRIPGWEGLGSLPALAARLLRGRTGRAKGTAEIGRV